MLLSLLVFTKMEMWYPNPLSCTTQILHYKIKINKTISPIKDIAIIQEEYQLV